MSTLPSAIPSGVMLNTALFRGTKTGSLMPHAAISRPANNTLDSNANFLMANPSVRSGEFRLLAFVAPNIAVQDSRCPYAKLTGFVLEPIVRAPLAAPRRGS